MFENSQIIIEGTFLYGETVTCDIRIFRHDMRYGSGDYEDDPEFQDDVEGEFYYIEFGSTTERGKFSSQSCAYPSLSAAIDEAEKRTNGTVRWGDVVPSNTSRIGQ